MMTKSLLKVGAMLAMLVAVTATLAGCSCGVAPASNYKNVNDQGAVQFDPTTVGTSEVLTIPMEDTVDTDEVITGASLTGPGAASFTVLTTFPMKVPAGSSVDVEVKFTPSAAGAASATLVFETEMMGPSPLDLEGVGSAP
jgi:Abnormal spindle-like microcephaly-assoc'd, ASPM-SPD-2-Hydin